MQKPFNISQSLLKDFQDYKHKKHCGLQLKAKYFDKIEFPPTESMQWGNYFEYLVTGATGKGDQAPAPERTQKGELTAKYKIMEAQAERCKKALDHYGIKIVEFNKMFVWEGHSMKVDIIGELTKGLQTKDRSYPAGTRIIIDTKTTGFLDNKWEDYGWHTESLEHKWKIMIQVVHYKWLSMKLGQPDLPFFFMIHSNTNNIESKIIEVVLDENTRYAEHEQLIEKTKAMIKMEQEIGFKANPDVKRCFECPLKETCGSFISVPEINTVYY